MRPTPPRLLAALLAGAVLLVAAGVALAVLRPGGLGDDAETPGEPSSTTAGTPAPTSERGEVTVTDETATTGAPTTSEATTTTGAEVPAASTTIAPDRSAATVPVSTTATTGTTATASTPTTQVAVAPPAGEPGSGLGTSGASRSVDAIADTGAESLLGPGLAAGALAAGLAATARRARA